MNKLLAISAAALMLPMGAFAQDLTGFTAAERRVCTVEQISTAAGVCSQVEMPVPPQDVQVQVYRRTVTTGGLGGLGTPGIVAASVVGIAIVAAIANDDNANGTNGTN